MLKLGTIEQERTACEKAWKGRSKHVDGWHCHHETLLENVYIADSRIRYIAGNKPREEQALRFRLFRPLQDTAALERIDRLANDRDNRADNRLEKRGRTDEAYVLYDRDLNRSETLHTKAMEALHAKECPDCPWNGETIFPEG